MIDSLAGAPAIRSPATPTTADAGDRAARAAPDTATGEHEVLARRAAAGDEAAFAALCAATYPAIVRLAWRLVGNRADAQDVAQETFVRIARNIGRFRGRATFRTWATRIALNAVRDLARGSGRERARRARFEDGLVASDGRTPEDALAARELAAAILALPAPLNETAVLAWWEGMSRREIAQTLGCAERTVSWRLARAIAQLPLPDRRDRAAAGDRPPAPIGRP